MVRKGATGASIRAAPVGDTAALGALRCDLTPGSTRLQARPTRPTTDPAVFTPLGEPPKICGQQKSRVPMTELPYWQHLQHGSTQRWDSINRRNRVEGFFGNVKNDAAQNITRGRFRVMGLARVSLMAMFLVMAANLRLTQTFHARQDQAARAAARAAAGHIPAQRKPRYHTQLLREMRARIAAEKQLAAPADATAFATADTAAGAAGTAATGPPGS